MFFRKSFFVSMGLLLVLAGCAQGDNLEERVNKLEQEIGSIKQDVGNIKSDLAEANLEEELTLYFIEETSTDFYLRSEKRSLPENELTPAIALEELLKGPKEGSDLKPVVPEGTKLLDFEVKGDTAEVNFNSVFMRNMNAGAQMEGLILAAIVNTLTEFPEIKKVQFLIEGQQVETIGGHIETSEPLTRDEEVLK